MNSNQKQRPSLESIQMHMWVVLNSLQTTQYGSLHPSQDGNNPHNLQLNAANVTQLNNNLLNLTQATAQSLAANQNVNLSNLAGNIPSNISLSAANSLTSFNSNLSNIQQRLNNTNLQNVQNGIQNLTNQALQTINSNGFNTNQLVQAQLQAQLNSIPHQMLHANMINGNLLAQQVAHSATANIQPNIVGQNSINTNNVNNTTSHSNSESNSNPTVSQVSPSQSTTESSKQEMNS